MAWENNHFYAVTTKHGDYKSFHSIEEAREYANQIMIGYLEGRTCANDPCPTILEIKEVEQLSFNPHDKSVYKRCGASFGSYHKHDCYQ